FPDGTEAMFGSAESSSRHQKLEHHPHVHSVVPEGAPRCLRVGRVAVSRAAQEPGRTGTGSPLCYANAAATHGSSMRNDPSAVRNRFYNTWATTPIALPFPTTDWLAWQTDMSASAGHFQTWPHRAHHRYSSE